MDEKRKSPSSSGNEMLRKGLWFVQLRVNTLPTYKVEILNQAECMYGKHTLWIFPIVDGYWIPSLNQSLSSGEARPEASYYTIVLRTYTRLHIFSFEHLFIRFFVSKTHIYVILKNFWNWFLVPYFCMKFHEEHCLFLTFFHRMPCFGDMLLIWKFFWKNFT